MEPGEPLSSSWLTRHHRTSHFANTRRPTVECEGLARVRVSRHPQWPQGHECEGLARDTQLNASFGRLSGRIGTAALCAPVAQRIERRFPKPCVGGSSPLRGARFSQFIDCFGGFSFFLHAHLRTLVTIWSQRGALSRPGDLLGMFHDGSQQVRRLPVVSRHGVGVSVERYAGVGVRKACLDGLHVHSATEQKVQVHSVGIAGAGKLPVEEGRRPATLRG